MHVLRNMRMSAYGRKQTSRPSLDGCSLTSALEKKADIRALELRARVNGRNPKWPKATVDTESKSVFLNGSFGGADVRPSDPASFG